MASWSSPSSPSSPRPEPSSPRPEPSSRAWDDMTDEEWAAFQDQLYEEQLEDLKQTLRVTTPFVCRQIGVMVGVALCRWIAGGVLGIQAVPIPNVVSEAKSHIIGQRFRRTVAARHAVFDGERRGFTDLD